MDLQYAFFFTFTGSVLRGAGLVLIPPGSSKALPGAGILDMLLRAFSHASIFALTCSHPSTALQLLTTGVRLQKLQKEGGVRSQKDQPVHVSLTIPTWCCSQWFHCHHQPEAIINLGRSSRFQWPLLSRQVPVLYVVGREDQRQGYW
jgi:hypothetical protein